MKGKLKSITFGLASVFIHIFLFHQWKTKFVGKKLEPINSRSFELEVEVKRRAVKRVNGLGKKSGGKKAGFGEFLNSYQKAPLQSELGGKGNISSTSEDRGAWGLKTNPFVEVENSTAISKIFNFLNQTTIYPAVFVSHNVHGVVQAQLFFREDSSCDWQQTWIKSNSDHLKIYVLSVLKKLCKNDFTQYKTGRLWGIDLSFSFEFTEHDDKDLVAVGNRALGHTIFIFRNSRSSAAEWSIGPFKGVFPVPYVSLDFNWLKENWEKAVEKRDLLREFDRGN